VEVVERVRRDRIGQVEGEARLEEATAAPGAGIGRRTAPASGTSGGVQAHASLVSLDGLVLTPPPAAG
jgi:hypothetical protein